MSTEATPRRGVDTTTEPDVELTGRTVCKGAVEGEALVTREPVAWFNTAMDDETGIIRKHGHELEGVSVAGKVVVFDTDIGSTGGSFGFYNKVMNGVGPIGIIYRVAHPISASGAVYTRTPAMDRINEGAPSELISTGDWVRLDATNSLIQVFKAAQD